MKHLKKFESLFDAAKPRQITGSEWSNLLKTTKSDFFSKSEHQYLIDLMESNGREYLGDEEWEERGYSEKLNNYQIGLTFLTFYIKSDDEAVFSNRSHLRIYPEPYEIHVHKSEDEWFFVSIYQVDDDYDEYYECDGFECLLDLLKTNCGLK
jgi:hypothetical protein